MDMKEESRPRQGLMHADDLAVFNVADTFDVHLA